MRCFRQTFNQVVGGSNPPCLSPLKALILLGFEGFLRIENPFDFYTFLYIFGHTSVETVWKLLSDYPKLYLRICSPAFLISSISTWV